ncbi:MAG TPA: OmpA family protein [Candidatus Kapabacteria bacterium]|nr:OmpA family protein [Candidatus Kapabacteria bacterium]
MFKRKEYKDDTHNTGADRYLITYADLITLLLGLFVVLYSSAQVDQEKFKEYSNALSEYFTAKNDKVLQGGDGVLQGNKQAVPEPILAPPVQKSLPALKDEISNKLNNLLSDKSISLVMEDSTLRISLSEQLLFKSGVAKLEQSGIIALDTIAKIINGTNFILFVDGHTDSDPIRTFQYESNWHLSTARATNVAYKLIRDGIDEYKIVIRGFGSQRPIADNTTSEGKKQNRRVDILLVPPDNLTPTKKGYIDVK